MPEDPRWEETELPDESTVLQVAKQHGCRESLMIHDYLTPLHKGGWRDIDIIPAPLSPERFKGKAASAMLKKRILGSTGRHIIIAVKKKGQ